MMEATYHLLHDVGMYKSTVKRNYEDNDREADVADVKELLERRTQRYTIAELKRLSLFFWTAHDDCVDANPEDFAAIHVYSARRKIKDGEAACARVAALSLARPQAAECRQEQP
jgi:hypothetical protein